MPVPCRPPPGRPPPPHGSVGFDPRQGLRGPRPGLAFGADQPPQNRVPSLFSTNLIRGPRASGDAKGLGSQLRQTGPRFDPSNNPMFGVRLAGDPNSRFSGPRMQQLSGAKSDDKDNSRINAHNDETDTAEGDESFDKQQSTVRHLPTRMLPVGTKLTSDVRQPGNLSGELGSSKPFDVKSEFSKLAAFRPSFSSMSKLLTSKSQPEVKGQEPVEQRSAFSANVTDNRGPFKDNSSGDMCDKNLEKEIHSNDQTNLDPQQRALMKLASTNNVPFSAVQQFRNNQFGTSDQQPSLNDPVTRLPGPGVRPLMPPLQGQVRPGSMPLPQHLHPPVDACPPQGPRPGAGGAQQPGFSAGDMPPRAVQSTMGPPPGFFPQELRPPDVQAGPRGDLPPQGFRPPSDMSSRGPHGNLPLRGFGPPGDTASRGPGGVVAPRGFVPPRVPPPQGPPSESIPQRFGARGESMPQGPMGGLTSQRFTAPDALHQGPLGDAAARGFGSRMDLPPPQGIRPLGPMVNRYPGHRPAMQATESGVSLAESGSSQNGPLNGQRPTAPSSFGNIMPPFSDGNQRFPAPSPGSQSRPPLAPSSENFQPEFNMTGLRPNFPTSEGQKPFFNAPGQSFGNTNNFNQFNSDVRPTKTASDIDNSPHVGGFGVQSMPQRPMFPPGGAMSQVRPLMQLETQTSTSQFENSNSSAVSSLHMSDSGLPRSVSFPPTSGVEGFVTQPPPMPPPAFLGNSFNIPTSAGGILPPPVLPVPPVGAFMPPITVPPPFGVQTVSSMPNIPPRPSMLPPPAMPVPPPMVPPLGFPPPMNNMLMPPFNLPPPFFTIPPPGMGMAQSASVNPAVNVMTTQSMPLSDIQPTPSVTTTTAAHNVVTAADTAPSTRSASSSKTDSSASDLPLWVETKTADGKVYYYNAESRESSWARPEKATIITQSELELLAANQSNESADSKTSASDKVIESSVGQTQTSNSVTTSTSKLVSVTADVVTSTSSSASTTLRSEPVTVKPAAAAAPLPSATEDTQKVTGSRSGSTTPDTNRSSVAEPTVQITDSQPPTVVAVVEPVVEKCDWSEHFNTDGRPYYYNSQTLESVWHKPQALIDWQAAQQSKPVVATADTKPSDVVPGSKTQQPIVNVGKSETSAETTTASSTAATTESDKSDKTADKQDQSADDESSEDDDTSDDKSRPVSSTPVPGTPWCVVWTGDDRVFFFNPSQNQSVWDCPDELESRADVKKLLQTPPSVVPQSANAADAAKSTAASKAGVASGAKVRKATAEGEPQAKRAKSQQDDVIIVHKSSRRAAQQQIKAGKDSAIEAEMKAAQERAMVPQEVRVQQFMEMLTEKQVSVFSTWEKELHKIVFDKRYLLLPSKERKQVYEQYIRERADEERREKSKKLRQRKDDFKQMLAEVKIPSRMSFSEFAARYGKDERFKAIDKMRDRELLFNDFVAEMRRREPAAGDINVGLQADKMKADFTQMLRETSSLTPASAWTEIRPRLESDLRYRTVPSNSMREEWFRDYCNLLDKETDDERRQRDKQERMFASLREREMAVKQSLSVSLRERDREREQHQKKEAVQHFNALVADMVRNADMSWREVRKMLHDDSRWKLTKLLDKAEKQALFEEHMLTLNRRNRDMFRRLIDENINAAELFTINWKDLRKMIKDDPRFGKFSSSDRKREKAFDEYRQEKLVQAKIDYRELLKETKQITYKSAKLIRESDQHLREISRVLENDQRHLMLECVADERQQILLSYIDDIERKGQPPPPTATDPGRRTNK